jgi:eukaryotic-like serine/threonine-protein kinase
MMCPACNARYDGGQFCAKDGTPLVKDQNAGKGDMVGQVLADRYRIVKLLGEGGMGQVYEAQHVNINKRFAIKLLRPEIVSNPEAVARFRQEAWSASSIGHDNIIEIDDFATLPNGSVYLAMEYLAGGSLAERMKNDGPIEPAESLDIFCQVARGLAAAHEKAIIHRDMKPENIFLAQKHGRTLVKILDFGIAKVSGAEGSHSLTRTGAIFGTPHYMSPEQALGKPLDHRSDIYSVGVIMYEVFTGRVPFEAESFMGILTKHITSEPRRPTEAAPDRQISDDVEHVIMRAMAKEPNDRYPTMGDLMNDLVAVMQVHAPHLLTPSGNQPLIARPPSQQIAVGTGPRKIAATMMAPSGTGQTPVVDGSRKPTPAAGLRKPSQPVAATMMAPGTGSQPVIPVREPSQRVAVAGPATDGVDAIPFANPEPLKKKGGGLGMILGIVGVLAAGGAAAAFVMFKKPADPVVVPNPPIAGPVVPKPVEPPKPVVTPLPPPDKPAAPEMLNVIVATTPPKAKILKDGVPIGETPEAVKVPAGLTVNVVLHLDGYIDEPVTVDPSKGRKLLVKLDKARGKAKDPLAASSPSKSKTPVYTSPSPVKLPAPPPVPQPVVASPPPKRPKPPVDPYERLDDKPAPKKGGDVLNPY